MTDELLAALEADPMERLRWLVTARFSLPPDTALTDAYCLWAAANMVLDARGKNREGSNPSFDTEEFSRLREAGND